MTVAATVVEWAALVAAFGVVLTALAAILKLVVRAWRYERLLRHVEAARGQSVDPMASDPGRSDDPPDDLP